MVVDGKAKPVPASSTMRLMAKASSSLMRSHSPQFVVVVKQYRKKSIEDGPN